MKLITISPLVLLLCASFGCARKKPVEAEPAKPVVETPTPVLTSTRAPEVPGLEEPPLPADPKPPQVSEEKDFEPPAAAAFEPVLDNRGGVRIQRLITTPIVEEREPVDARAVFDHHDEKVIAFIEASNDTSDAHPLFVHFIGPSGTVTGGVELVIPADSPRWRTWAFTRFAKEPGLWRVEIRDAEGVLVGALPFEVEPGC